MIDDKEIQKIFNKCINKKHPEEFQEELFGKINEMYNIFTNDIKYVESDKEDENNNISLENYYESLGVKKIVSKEFKILLNKWIIETPKILLIDNISDEIKSIMDKNIYYYNSNNIICQQKYKCPICNIETLDQKEHDNIFLEKYNNFINTITSTTLIDSIREYVGINAWSWEKIKYPSIREKINLIENHIEPAKNMSIYFLEALEATQSLENISNYFGQSEDSEYEKIGELLSSSEDNFDSVIASIDIEKIILLIQNNSIKLPPPVSGILKSEKDRRIKKGTYKIVDGMEKIIENVPNITIKDCPMEVKYSDRSNCQYCKKKFGISTQKYNCRMCGEVFCFNCLCESKIPLLGYNFNVKVCINCKNEITCQIPLEWLNYAKKCNNDIEIAKIVFIASLYKANNQIHKYFENLGDYFFGIEKYKLAIHCYQYAQMEINKWFILIKKFIINKKYMLATTCASKIKNIDNMLWINAANDSFNSLINDRPINITDIMVTIFFYEHGNENYINLCSELVSLHKSGQYEMRNIFAYYLLWKYKKNDLLKIAKIIFDAEIYDIAVHFYYLGGYMLNDWIKIIEDLCINNKYLMAIQIWKSICKKYTINNQQIQYINTNYLHKVLTDLPSVDIFLSELIDALNKKLCTNIYLCLAYIIIYHSKKLYSLVEKYMMTCEYNKVFISNCLCQFLGINNSSWIDLGNKFLSRNKITEAFQCYECANIIWKELGDDLFQNKQYDGALNCYLLSDNIDINKHIFDKASELIKLENNPMAYIYFSQLFKLNKMVYRIIVELGKNINTVNYNKNLKYLIIAFLKTKSNIFEKKYIIIHDNLCKLLEYEDWYKYLVEIIGCLHIIAKFDISSYATDKLSKFIGLYELLETNIFSKQLKEYMYVGDSKKIVQMITNLNKFKIIITKSICSEQIKQNETTNLPGYNRYLIHLLRASINIYEKEYINALNDLKKSLLYYPTKEHSEAISIFLHNNELQAEIHRRYILELTKIDNLSMFELPTTNKYQKLFKENKIRSIIEKIEKYIGKTIKHEEAALFYMDLSTIIYDTMGLIGCFILSAFHFYKASLNMTDILYLHAYRNIIFHICMRIYEISHNHLTSFMQIYISKHIIALIMNINLHLSKNNSSNIVSDRKLATDNK